MSQKSAILFVKNEFKAGPPVEIKIKGVKEIVDIEPLGDVEFVR